MKIWQICSTNQSEAVILKGLMNKNMFGLPDEEADYMRGKIIRLVLVTLLRDDLT